LEVTKRDWDSAVSNARRRWLERGRSTQKKVYDPKNEALKQCKRISQKSQLENEGIANLLRRIEPDGEIEGTSILGSEWRRPTSAGRRDDRERV
jgi:hypothetical protein